MGWEAVDGNSKQSQYHHIIIICIINASNIIVLNLLYDLQVVFYYLSSAIVFPLNPITKPIRAGGKSIMSVSAMFWCLDELGELPLLELE